MFVFESRLCHFESKLVGNYDIFITNHITNVLVTILSAIECSLYNMKMPEWIDIPITSIPVRVSGGSETDLTSYVCDFLVLGLGIHWIGFLV